MKTSILSAEEQQKFDLRAPRDQARKEAFERTVVKQRTSYLNSVDLLGEIVCAYHGFQFCPPYEPVWVAAAFALMRKTGKRNGAAVINWADIYSRELPVEEVLGVQVGIPPRSFAFMWCDSEYLSVDHVNKILTSSLGVKISLGELLPKLNTWMDYMEFIYESALKRKRQNKLTKAAFQFTDNFMRVTQGRIVESRARVFMAALHSVRWSDYFRRGTRPTNTWFNVDKASYFFKFGRFNIVEVLEGLYDDTIKQVRSMHRVLGFPSYTQNHELEINHHIQNSDLRKLIKKDLMLITATSRKGYNRLSDLVPAGNLEKYALINPVPFDEGIPFALLGEMFERNDEGFQRAEFSGKSITARVPFSIFERLVKPDELFLMCLYKLNPDYSGVSEYCFSDILKNEFIVNHINYYVNFWRRPENFGRLDELMSFYENSYHEKVADLTPIEEGGTPFTRHYEKLMAMFNVDTEQKLYSLKAKGFHFGLDYKMPPVQLLAQSARLANARMAAMGMPRTKEGLAIKKAKEECLKVVEKMENPMEYCFKHANLEIEPFPESSYDDITVKPITVMETLKKVGDDLSVCIYRFYKHEAAIQHYIFLACYKEEKPIAVSAIKLDYLTGKPIGNRTSCSSESFLLQTSGHNNRRAPEKAKEALAKYVQLHVAPRLKTEEASH